MAHRACTELAAPVVSEETVKILHLATPLWLVWEGPSAFLRLLGQKHLLVPVSLL